MPRNVN